MNGDHKNLKVHGACERVMSPTTRISTPAFRSQSGIAIQTKPKGRPDEKESKTTDAVRQDRIASRMLVRTDGFSSSFLTNDHLQLLRA
jgi:hypothetical protein